MNTETQARGGKRKLINAIYVLLSLTLIFLYIAPTPGNNIFSGISAYFSSLGGTKSPLAVQRDSASKACQIVGIGTFAERNLDIPYEIEGYRVTSIGDSALRGQDRLANVSIHGDIYAIGNYTFADCRELSTVTVENGTQIIGIYAFMNCGYLSTISLPSTLTYIGRGAFLGCSNLKEIHFGGTVEKWHSIASATAWNENNFSFTVYCIDGEISAKSEIA